MLILLLHKGALQRTLSQRLQPVRTQHQLVHIWQVLLTYSVYIRHYILYEKFLSRQTKKKLFLKDEAKVLQKKENHILALKNWKMLKRFAVE